MQYNPTLKKAMEEIKQILQKYDIAGQAVLHSPGHSEYMIHITPTYSCAWFENNGVRFRATKKDYNGNEMIRNQKIKDTSNMLALLSETTAKNALSLLAVSKKLDQIIGSNHTEGGHTTHSTQNN